MIDPVLNPRSFSVTHLAQKKIILGITGGIAAYKSAELTRRLKEQGADVRVVMTPSAKEFITPLTFQALSGNPVSDSLLDRDAEAAMGHIELARWADLILIAPASADFLARLSHGFANDLLSTLCLATSAPIAVAPAMNQLMWQNKATQANCHTLKQRGILLLGPNSGDQACGETGLGRMMEPDQLVSATIPLLKSNDLQTGPLHGKKVVITAGPTREALDPIRFISNHSSGKMGFALARAAIAAGAQTIIIAGPVHQETPDGAERINTVTAKGMYQASLEHAPDADIFIATAAVADYRPLQRADQKIKKSAEQISIELTRNPDIIAAVAALSEKPFTVGFAAETNDLISYAKGKLQNKKLDLIVANDVARSDIGFNSDQNAVTVISADKHQNLTQANKDQIAEQLIEIIASAL
ncbi:MAG: bifunctional phosphopantothenoylcysteine decarboxylase/phosphopantothenate--cysteine ligase CoaBC [Gammaproteobacteria bacterium]|nr:bifunctional phosphopantothenoylcysteine decarboxylase/phosphopantothenate--cysteine ligase CoaBC [Gammaproteobacteria bacterium]